jgi:hypothetical protein
MRWGKAVIGVAWYLVLPTEMREILNQEFKRFADDAVVKISRWCYATTGWNAQCRRYAQTVVDTTWQGQIDKFRDGVRRVWRPPGIKLAHQGGKPTKEKAANAPQSAQTNEDERAVVKKALMTLNDSELQVIAHSPVGDLLHETARHILADRPNQPKTMFLDGATDKNSGKPPEIKAANQGGNQSESSLAFSVDQVPDGFFAVRHGRKYRSGGRWVLTTKKWVYIRTFDEEAALDQWWKDFQQSQKRNPLPLITGTAPPSAKDDSAKRKKDRIYKTVNKGRKAKERESRRKRLVCPRCGTIWYRPMMTDGERFGLEECPHCKSDKFMEPFAKVKTQSTRLPITGGRVLHPQGQTRKVGGRRSSS